jgi:RHS repeat-associated protein
MLAVHHFAGFAPAMLKRLMRTLLAALAVVLMLAFSSGTSWAQRVIDAPNIQAPPSPSIQMPPPDDPDPQPSYYDAATGVSISAPSTMAPGATAYVTVTIRNSGTTTWYPGVANPYRLGSQNPQDNTTWGVGRVELGSTVAPGGNAVFGFTITAPSTPGSYVFGWAMLREGMYWFGGNISSSITVAVPPPVYDAQLISASVPSSMTAGSYYNVSMTLKNTGNTTWTSPDFSLANTDDNYTFGPNRVAMSPSTVAPGQSSTFNFQVRAPATAGSYTFQWGMVWEYHQRFGQNSTTYITVSAPAPVTPRPTISVSRPSLTAGQSFTTSWSTTDATSLTHVCTSSGTGYTVNESLAVNGSRALTAQSAWVGYPSSCTWTASGAGGSATYTETMTTTAAAVNGSVTYVHTDGLGSPVAKTDSNGTVISRTRYEPYGYVASGDQPTIGFTGHVNDVDTGLTYMQQRYYDPVAGRFLSIDPVLTDVKTGGSFNRYEYANNSPYTNIDPDGRAVESITVDRNNNVHIVVGMTYRGAITPAQAKMLNNYISSNLNGKIGKYAVNITIIPGSQAKLGNFVTVVEGRGRSEAIGNGAREATLYTQESNGASMEQAMLHEFMHFLGNKWPFDHYYDNGKVEAGWEGNINGDAVHGKVEEKNIDEMLEHQRAVGTVICGISCGPDK